MSNTVKSISLDFSPAYQSTTHYTAALASAPREIRYLHWILLTLLGQRCETRNIFVHYAEDSNGYPLLRNPDYRVASAWAFPKDGCKGALLLCRLKGKYHCWEYESQDTVSTVDMIQLTVHNGVSCLEDFHLTPLCGGWPPNPPGRYCRPVRYRVPSWYFVKHIVFCHTAMNLSAVFVSLQCMLFILF